MEKSNLEKHAEYEMKLAGLYDKDSNYGGMIPEAVMKLVKVHSSERHSGGSHHITMQVFNKVANFKTLTPITSNPEEWFHISEQVGGPNLWQNIRQSSTFSCDGGKTWYDIDDPKRKNWPNRGFKNWLKRKLKLTK